MEFHGESNEYLYVSAITSKDVKLFSDKLEYNLVVLWNTNNYNTIGVDGIDYELKPYEIMLLTEFHKIDISRIETLRCIKFNRQFYCVHNFNEKIGCRGILFFWASQIPIISLDEENINRFEILWTVFEGEISQKYDLQGEMLLILLKRFLILTTRIYKDKYKMEDIEDSKIDVLRNYFYLVEIHFKSKHSVAEYAELLNRPAKSITNLFSNHYKKSPLKVIQERIFIEAKRYLSFSEKSIKEIAFELGYNDMQSFSRFFKSMEGVSPKEYRQSNNMLN
jgi:AraC family transcriptional regulator, transcriptional activator of pobA